MTLNYSHRTYFPVNLPEENLASSVKDWYVFDGMWEKNGGMPPFVDWNWGNSFDFRYDQSEKGGSFESVATDVIDLLPSDPFGMGISATITAIAGWVGDFESERVNIKWNRTSFQTEPVKMGVYEGSNLPSGFDGNMAGPHEGESAVNCKGEKHLSFNNEDVQPATDKYTESDKGTDVAEGDPHDAFQFALGHLGLRDLLSLEGVCRSLRSSIKDDSFLWRNISIHKPSSSRITDEDLLQLTNRAEGNLLSLSLEGCSRITDDGLKCVLDNNKRLTKLNVDRCIGLSVQCIVDKLKDLKSDTSGINHLRIGDRNVTREQFVNIKCLIGEDKCMQLKADKPYFRSGHSSPCDDDLALDIEECPRCRSPRRVYDCPVESCKGKQSAIKLCRGCTSCIPRCGECGRCVNGTEYVETFFLEKVCLKCQEHPSPDHVTFGSGAGESSTSGLI